MKSAVGWPVGLGSSLLAALAAHRNLSHSHGLLPDPTQPAVKQGGSGENGGGASPVFQSEILPLSACDSSSWLFFCGTPPQSVLSPELRVRWGPFLADL